MSGEAVRGRIASLVAGGMSMEYAIRKVKQQDRLASINLLSCPFCWGRAELDNSLDGHGETFKSEYMVQCTECGGLLDNGRKSPELAAEDWNTRRKITAVVTYADGTEQNCYATHSPSEIANGLLHVADDHPCCRATLHAAANILNKISL
tara:strand:- start:1222 stop:1671 length:450 start_codon:yes stop_codon:yes gene_type:complete